MDVNFTVPPLLVTIVVSGVHVISYRELQVAESDTWTMVIADHFRPRPILHLAIAIPVIALFRPIFLDNI